MAEAEAARPGADDPHQRGAGGARAAAMSLLDLTLALLTITGVWMWAVKPRRRR
ncbi:MAG: hypothetical protein ACREEO_16905 [Phenylobacterium sp.]